MAELLRYDEDQAFSLMDDAATVSRIVRTVGRDRLRAALFDAWDAVAVIGHLTYVAEVFAERVRRATTEDAPVLEAIPEGAGAHQEADPLDLARRLQRAHRTIVTLLQPPGAPTRAAVHAEWGRVDAGHLAAYLARHSRAHVAELAAAFPPER